MISGELKSLYVEINEAFLCYFEKETEDNGLKCLLHDKPAIHGVVRKFSDVSSDRCGLPLHRERGHFIRLQLGSKPINVIPYGFPHFQNN